MSTATATEAPAETAKEPKPVDELTKEEYLALVQTVATRVIRERGWCKEESDPVLAELGLPPLPELKQHWVILPYTAEHRVSVSAVDEADAKAQIQRTVDDGYSGDWGRYLRYNLAGGVRNPRHTGEVQVTRSSDF